MVLCDSTFYSTATFRQSFYNSDLFKVLQDVTKNVPGGSPSEVFRPNSLSVCTTIHTLQFVHASAFLQINFACNRCGENVVPIFR